MDAMLDNALQYAGRGWPVFFLSKSKVPFKGTHGHLDATTDPETLRQLWQPGANVGLACGELVVVDCDGQEAYARLRAAAEPHGGIPDTLMAQTTRTGGGLHLYFKCPAGAEIRTRNERRKRGASGIDVKGLGGYVLLPPSTNKKGKSYKWLRDIPPVELPTWLQAFLSTTVTPPAARSEGLGLGQKPDYLKQNNALGERGVLKSLDNSLSLEWSTHNEARLEAALEAIDAKALGYDEWVQVGMALHSLGWQRSDGSDAGLELWHWFSEADGDRYQADKLETHWRSFGRRSSGPTKGIGYVFHLAREAGWDGSVVLPEAGQVDLQVNGAIVELPAQLAAGANRIVFPDTDRAGHPKVTCTNTRVAIGGLGVACALDVFHNKMLVGGQVIDQWAGELSDNALQVLRHLIRSQFGFDPGLPHVHDASVQLCLQSSYDPVLDYLDGLQWDGTPRVRHWLARYMGAQDSSLNQYIGALALIAAIRRVKVPGIKFDQILVFESHEGRGKSTAIEIMAGSDNFSDQSILTLDDKAQQEAMQGVWIYEIADMAGMSRADVERVKAFASRKVDRARPAYGRARIDRPRRCVFWATTNDESYLKSQTGNRRFWPVSCGGIDLESLKRDRDQLWAEAVVLEKKWGAAPLFLPEALWGAAKIEQDKRLERDPWDELLEHVKGHKVEIPTSSGWEFRISSRELMEQHLRLNPDKINAVTGRRLLFSMRRLGWDGPKPLRHEGVVYKGYTRNE